MLGSKFTILNLRVKYIFISNTLSYLRKSLPVENLAKEVQPAWKIVVELFEDNSIKLINSEGTCLTLA